MPDAITLLEQRQVFSRSLLWHFQRRYFEERGPAAWRLDEVPHAITDNPVIANTYAELVFACLRDHQQADRSTAENEPLVVCELGAGSGRMAYHFLRRLTALCEQFSTTPGAFCYVLTDFTQDSLDLWRRHPRFQPYFERGLLDCARFDVMDSDRLSLQVSGRTLAPGDLARPLAVLANYVFDSIPQDLFYIGQKQVAHCRLSLYADSDPGSLPVHEVLARLRYEHDYEPIQAPPFDEPYLQSILDEYQQTLSGSHLIFPTAALRCLHRLKALSRTGLLLLSADKGEHRMEDWQGQPPPSLVYHGSVSMLVNYHAFKRFCERQGGLALFPDYHSENLSVNALLMVEGAGGYVETQRAYRRHVQDFSPDDYYVMTRQARPHLPQMGFEDLLAHLRLGLYDSYQFGRFLPRLIELAPRLQPFERRALLAAVDRVWESYFPLGEALDLAYQIASLLYALDEYAGALTYFERSIELYGTHSGTLYNMALCCQLMGDPGRAAALLQTVLRHEPENADARRRLESLAAAGAESENRRRPTP